MQYYDPPICHIYQLWLTQDPSEEYLEAMMGEAPGPINFTMFLTLFGERLQVCLRLKTFKHSPLSREPILRRPLKMPSVALTRRMWGRYMRFVMSGV